MHEILFECQIKLLDGFQAFYLHDFPRAVYSRKSLSSIDEGGAKMNHDAQVTMYAWYNCVAHFIAFMSLGISTEVIGN